MRIEGSGASHFPQFQQNMGPSLDNEAKQLLWMASHFLNDEVGIGPEGGFRPRLNALIKYLSDEMKPPISQQTLIKMQNQYNEFIQDFSASGYYNYPNWDIENDQKRPGYSMISFMVPYLQHILNTNFGPNAEVAKQWLQKFEQVLRAPPGDPAWNPDFVTGELNKFFSDMSQAFLMQDEKLPNYFGSS